MKIAEDDGEADEDFPRKLATFPGSRRRVLIAS